MESDFEKLGPMLLAFRKALGFKQKKMAEALGMEQYYYATVERGERVPGRDKLLDICSYFNITLDEITTYFDSDNTTDKEALLLEINSSMEACSTKQLIILKALIRDILPLM